MEDNISLHRKAADAVCRGVQTAVTREVSYRSVVPAEPEQAVYQPVKPALPEPVRYRKQVQDRREQKADVKRQNTVLTNYRKAHGKITIKELFS